MYYVTVTDSFTDILSLGDITYKKSEGDIIRYMDLEPEQGARLVYADDSDMLHLVTNYDITEQKANLLLAL